MNRLVISLLRPVSILCGAMGVALCALYVALLIWATIRRGQWSPLPDDAVAINLDPLQSLAFLLAWTGLVGAVMVGVSNKIRDVTRNYNEAVRLGNDTRVILDRAESRLTESGESDKRAVRQSSATGEAISHVLAFIQFVGRQGQRWYAWTYLFFAVSFFVLRLRWALMQIDSPSIGDEITVISVPASAAWNILFWWSLAVVATVERTVHVWRWLLTDSEQLLRTAREYQDEAVNLEQSFQRISDDQ